MAGYVVPQYQWVYQNAAAASGTIDVYITGTTTHVTIYADNGLIAPLANPFTLDSNGEGKFYVDGTFLLRIDAKTSTGTLINSIDPVMVVPDLSGFTGEGADLNALDGAVAGTVTAGKALVVDSNSNITGLATNTFGTSAASIANMAAVMGSMTGGFINKFRNGNFGVWQRGATGTINSTVSSYALDGWIITPTGATLTWSNGFSGSLNTNIMNLACAAGITDCTVKQRIESVIAYPLANQQVTFQCVIRNATGSSFTPTLTVKHATAADNWGATVTDINAIALQACPNGVSTAIGYTFSSSASSTNGLEITLDLVGALNQNAGGGVQVQIAFFDIRASPGVSSGANASPPVFENRPISVTLLECSRYYTNTFPTGTAPAQNAGVAGSLGAQPYGATAGMLYTQWQFPVQMRASPTITTYNPSAANANWRDTTGSSDVVVSVDPDTTKAATGVLIASQTTALTAGHRCYIHAAASAEL